MKKKNLLVLALILIFTFAFSASASALTFRDIPNNHWAKPTIDDVSDRGIFIGTEPGLFSPDDTLTNAMTVTVLARLAGADIKAPAENPFTDVNKDMWFAGAAAWAKDNLGLNKVDTLNYNAGTTRLQIAGYLVNFAKLKGVTLPNTSAENLKFDDLSGLSSTDKENIALCVGLGLLQGNSATNYDPNAVLNRAQMATIIDRLAEKIGVTYTITFNSNGGTAVAEQKIDSGKLVTKPTDPTKSGVTFDGWYTDSECTKAFDFTTKIEKNYTLYAKWATIKHSGGGGGTVIPQVTVTSKNEANYILNDGGIIIIPKDNGSDNTNWNTISTSYITPDTFDFATYTASTKQSGKNVNINGYYFPKLFATESPIEEREPQAVENTGYCVILRFAAPSSFNKATSGPSDVEIGPMLDSNGNPWQSQNMFALGMDGQPYVYAAILVSKDLENPICSTSINWNGKTINYSLDFSGMIPVDSKEVVGAVSADIADWEEMEPDQTLEPIQYNYVDAVVTNAANPTDQPTIHVFGKYLPQYDKSKNNYYYYFPLKFKAPDGAIGTANTNSESDALFISQDLTEDGYAIGDVKINLDDTSAKQITVTWNMGDGAEPLVVTYNLDLSNMIRMNLPAFPQVMTTDELLNDFMYFDTANVDTESVPDDNTITTAKIPIGLRILTNSGTLKATSSRDKDIVTVTLNGKYNALNSSDIGPILVPVDPITTLSPETVGPTTDAVQDNELTVQGSKIGEGDTLNVYMKFALPTELDLTGFSYGTDNVLNFSVNYPTVDDSNDEDNNGELIPVVKPVIETTATNETDRNSDDNQITAQDISSDFQYNITKDQYNYNFQTGRYGIINQNGQKYLQLVLTFNTVDAKEQMVTIQFAGGYTEYYDVKLGNVTASVSNELSILTPNQVMGMTLNGNNVNPTGFDSFLPTGLKVINSAVLRGGTRGQVVTYTADDVNKIDKSAMLNETTAAPLPSTGITDGKFTKNMVYVPVFAPLPSGMTVDTTTTTTKPVAFVQASNSNLPPIITNKNIVTLSNGQKGIFTLLPITAPDDLTNQNSSSFNFNICWANGYNQNNILIVQNQPQSKTELQ